MGVEEPMYASAVWSIHQRHGRIAAGIIDHRHRHRQDQLQLLRRHLLDPWLPGMVMRSGDDNDDNQEDKIFISLLGRRRYRRMGGGGGMDGGGIFAKLAIYYDDDPSHGWLGPSVVSYQRFTRKGDRTLSRSRLGHPPISFFLFLLYRLLSTSISSFLFSFSISPPCIFDYSEYHVCVEVCPAAADSIASLNKPTTSVRAKCLDTYAIVTNERSHRAMLIAMLIDRG